MKPFGLMPWQRQAIADAYGAGEKLEAVAAEFHVTSGLVSRYGRAAGHPPRQVRRNTRTLSQTRSNGQSRVKAHSLAVSA